jgi:hypothetical protein
MTLVLLLSACDAGETAGMGVGAVFVGPSAAPLLAATITQPTFSPLSCSTGVVTGLFSVAMTASSAVELNEVTIHMIDGTNLGGPMVTIPQQSLMSQFGTVRIAAGTTSTFRFHPQFTCISGLPLGGVSANIVFLDGGRQPHNITVVATLP